MKLSVILTGLLILAVAGLAFGQAPAPQKPAPAKAPVTAVKVRPELGKVPLLKKDGLQCILSKAAEINAAYTEAAQSGCKAVTVGQSTMYNCGFHPAPGLSKCQEAASKLKTILDGCGLKPPVCNCPSSSGGGLNLQTETPGCDSLGISCTENPA